MESLTESHWLLVVLCFSTASAIMAKEPEKEATTEFFDFPIQGTSQPSTEPPRDNGMAIGEIPEQQIPTSFPIGLQGKVEEVEVEPEAVEPQAVLIAFPENHKNFTPSQYLGDQEHLPFYNQLNSYQEQYRNYYEQKKLFDRKPIKFEENSTNNFFVPQGVNSYAGGEGYNYKTKLATLNLKPFPYVFENQKIPQNWYKNTGSGQIEVHEDRIPNNEYTDQGYIQDNLLPYYSYTQGNPHEHGFYKNEYLHHDHHHAVTKDDKFGSPWKKVFKVLTALVPLGLFLATLTPNVITVNSTTANPTPLRQRSEDIRSNTRSKFKEEDVLKLLKEYGVDSFNESQCEDRVICELARTGMDSAANSIEKGFWYLANETPWDVAEKAGMNELFRAIKTGNCESFKCLPKTKSNAKTGFGKTVIRKRKHPQ